MISILPEDICSLLQEYLLQSQWKQFIKSSRCLFSKWKSKLIYRLKDKYSKEYYFNENNFRDRFLSLTEINPREKLVLIFISPLFAKVNTTVTENLHGLLLLWNANSLQSLNGLSSLTRLTLDGCQATDFSCLGTVRYPDLSDNLGVTTAGGLGNVYDLNLSFCKNLIDTSDLGQNHYALSLSYCPKIREVDHLKNVRYCLDLSGNPLIENITALAEIPNLRIATAQVYELFHRSQRIAN
jgi:hypothetical protein